MKRKELLIIKTIYGIFLAILLGTVFPVWAANGDADTFRENTVARMREMATILWIPTENIPYWNKDIPNVFFKKGVLYEGIPYTQRHRETPPELFRENIDENSYYTGPDDYIGTDCSSSVSIAWRTVDAELPCLSTHQMFPGMGKIIAVGDYKVTSLKSTSQIVLDNGEAKICAAYDQLKPGDAILTRNNGIGHVRMVIGTDPAKRKISIIEQTGLSKEHQFKGRRGTWRVDYWFSYEELIENSYIPITHQAFTD